MYFGGGFLVIAHTTSSIPKSPARNLMIDSRGFHRQSDFAQQDLNFIQSKSTKKKWEMTDNIKRTLKNGGLDLFLKSENKIKPSKKKTSAFFEVLNKSLKKHDFGYPFKESIWKGTSQNLHSNWAFPHS